MDIQLAIQIHNPFFFFLYQIFTNGINVTPVGTKMSSSPGVIFFLLSLSFMLLSIDKNETGVQLFKLTSMTSDQRSMNFERNDILLQTLQSLKKIKLYTFTQ